MFLVWARSGNSKFHICSELQKLVNGPNTDNHPLMSFSPSTLVSLMTQYFDLMLVAQRLGSYMMTRLQTGLITPGAVSLNCMLDRDQALTQTARPTLPTPKFCNVFALLFSFFRHSHCRDIILAIGVDRLIDHPIDKIN